MRKVFKWFTLSSENISLVQINWFVEQFDISEFEGIDKVLWLFLKYCADLDIPALKQYLSAFLQTDSKRLIKKHNIKLNTLENYKYDEPAMLEEASRIIASDALVTYEEYLKEDLTDRTFKVDVKSFMEERKVERLQLIMAEAFPRLSNGDDTDELMLDLQYSIEKVQNTYDVNNLNKLDFMSNQTSISHGTEKMSKLFNTGIPCIDGDIGGMFTKMVWSFTGSPGSGKTRFAMAHMAYRAAVGAKIDVLIDELELSKMEIENMLIAHHIVHLYKGKVKIADSDMNKGDLSPEQKRYYEAAKMDLFESGKYGKIVIRTDDLVVETLEKSMYSYLRHNRGTKLWIIDYAGLAKSKPVGKYDKRYDDYEIIVEVYKSAKTIAKVADIGVFILNQFNEKGNEAAYAGKRILPGHVQGGQIVSRHADYDIAMTMTEEQELASMRMLSTVKKRGAKGFRNIPVSVDPAVSLFRQNKQ